MSRIKEIQVPKTSSHVQFAPPLKPSTKQLPLPGLLQIFQENGHQRLPASPKGSSDAQSKKPIISAFPGLKAIDDEASRRKKAASKRTKAQYGPSREDYDSYMFNKKQGHLALLRSISDVQQSLANDGPGFSAPVRDLVNGWEESLSKSVRGLIPGFSLLGLLAPEATSHAISQTLLTPAEIAAEMDTFVDPKESLTVRTGALAGC